MRAPDEHLILKIIAWPGSVPGLIDCRLYRNMYEDLPVVILTEQDDNPGPSITNGAEFYWPVVMEQLDINIEQAILLESYPRPFNNNSSISGLDPEPTYDQVLLYKAPLTPGYVVDWRPIPVDMASQLQGAGLILSQQIGHQVNIRGREIPIALYNGRMYYAQNKHGRFESIDLMRQFDSAEWVW